MNRLLKIRDPKMYELLQKEYARQKKGLELIASENFTSRSVLDCLGSIFTNKYSEGQIGERYYGGCEVIDEVEKLCKERALSAFHLDSQTWHVNVQPYSGSPANMGVYLGILKPHDRIMGLDLPSGGHLTHGFYTKNKKISATSIVFESFPYKINSKGYIDYDALEKIAFDFKPKLIICGSSAYPRDFDYARFRQIADKSSAYLMCDMAHISGIVSRQRMNNPFEFCDIVTSTTHKTLRGPRSGLIFCKKELGEQIDFSVFPGLQGGPHNHQIAALATQLLEVTTPEFSDYIDQVLKNAKTLASWFTDHGYELSTGGTDNHILLINLKNKGVSGAKIEYLCEQVNISLNKNSVFGDTSAANPSGIRIGTAALTTRNFKEEDFIKVGEFIDSVVCLAQIIQERSGKKLVDFKKYITENEDIQQNVWTLSEEVTEFAWAFPFIDFE